MRLSGLFRGVATLALCEFALTALAAPTPEQRRAAAEVQAVLVKAGGLYKQGKFAESAAAVKEAQAKAEAMLADGNAETQNLLKPALASLEKAHALLELEGVKLPPLKKPADIAKTNPMPAPANPANPPNPANPASPAAPPATGISFTKHIAPLLTGKCGRCHVSDMKGEFSMANYQALMRGRKGARVILPGDGDDSRIVQVIAEGDMPRGGAKVSAAELNTLKQWIKEGAKFDGPDPMAAITTFAAASQPMNAAPPPMVARATGRESISFARDIAPHLAATCTNCHGDRQPRAMFNLTTFTGLLKGGESGPNILPGKPSESLLIQKLKGTAGDRMPLNLPPLSDDVIAKFEKWIAEGAKFDGERPDMQLTRVAALAIAKHSTHEELGKMREEQAAGHWRLGMPGIKNSIATTTNFYVMGNVGENTLADIGKQAEEQSPTVAKLFGAPEDKPLIKGRMTLFVFDKRYDYSEFGKMVEKRDLPTSWRGHWKFDVVSAYGAVVPPKAGDYSLQTLIAQQVASAYVSSAGECPPWFAEGAGRVAAARLDPKDPRVQQWDADLSAVVATMQAPDDFLTGKLGGEETQVVAYSFVKFLMGSQPKFNAVLTDLRAGQSFDAAFAKAYGGSPSEVAVAWARKGVGSKKR